MLAENELSQIQQAPFDYGYSINQGSLFSANNQMGADNLKTRWSSKEIRLLKEIYPTKGNKEIAEILDRTYPSVSRKARKLNLKKNRTWLKAVRGDNLKKAPRAKGINHPRWNNNKNYYKSVSSKEHPFCDKAGRILEHRLVMEQWMRSHRWWHESLIELEGASYLSPNYVVHHKNGLRDDNRICNLEITKQKYHMIQHMTQIRFKIKRNCEWCNKDILVRFSSDKRGFCNTHCSNKYLHKQKGHKIAVSEKQASLDAKAKKYPFPMHIVRKRECKTGSRLTGPGPTRYIPP